MALTRRQFLTLTGGSAAAAVIFQACGVPEDELLVQSPFEMPEDAVTGLQNWYATTCRQCPTGEGLVVKVMEGRAKKVEGNVDHPINRGRHSARCEASLQALYHPDRIKGPLVRAGERGSGQFEEISWTDAISRMTLQMRNLSESGNQSSLAMVTAPLGGHLGMVVERFVSRYGGRHVPYEPLERTTLRRAIKHVFNQDVMPDFDIERSSYVLSFGADWLNTWTSPVRYSLGYGEFRQGDRERGTLVHADSRFSMTAANADRWLHVEPGTEGILALSMAQVIVSEGLGNSAAAAQLTGNGALDLDAFAPERVAGRISTAVPASRMVEDIREVARDFAGHRPALAFGGGSAGAHTNGFFNLAAIYSLNYLVESVGEPGGIVFNPKPPLGDLPVSPATESFSTWSRMVSEMNQKRVGVMMVHGADPFYGLPDSTGFRLASFNVPYIFSFSGTMDDTTAMSDLVLPDHDPLEAWGSDVPDPGPGYEMVGYQQPVVRPFFEDRGGHLGTRGLGDVLMAAAQDLGMDLGLPGETFRDVLQDGARQLFDLNRGSVSAPDFRSFWHGVLQRGGWWDVGAASAGGAPSSAPALPSPQDPVFGGDAGSYPMHLVPFASASLTDGRGAALPWLQATPDPISTATWRTWVEINASVADDMGVKEGDVVKITSSYGSIEALAFPNPATPFKVVSVPVGQGHRSGGRYAKDRGANVLSILAPGSDSETGALAWAATRVKIEKTGEWVRLPKFENSVSDPPEDEHQEIIKITPVDSNPDH